MLQNNDSILDSYSKKLDALASDLLTKLDFKSRLPVGIVGAPGSGKSTLARSLVDKINGTTENEQTRANADRVLRL